MPLMVTRLIISLKKAVEAPELMWSGSSQVTSQAESVMFAVGGTEHPAGDDVALENISWGSRGGGQ
jgi:hypothetical protein